MSLKKSRWSKVYESSEEELLDLLAARGISAERIHGDAMTEQSVSASEVATTMWCAEGSLTVQTSEKRVSMQPGDTLQIPSGTQYTTVAGISGYGYYLA